MSDKEFLDYVPFPYVSRKVGIVDFVLDCPIDNNLKKAIRTNMDDHTALEMIFLESEKLFPSFAINSGCYFDFENEAVKLKEWIESALKNVSYEIKSLYFSSWEDEISEEDNDDDITTYSISICGANVYDDNDDDWITETKSLTDTGFFSKTLDELYKLKREINDKFNTKGNTWAFDQFCDHNDYIERIILYGYCVLLIAKAIKLINDKGLIKRIRNLKIVFGMATNNEIVPFHAIEFSELI